MGINPTTEIENEENNRQADPEPLQARQLFRI
jgi:hypothetical protein